MVIYIKNTKESTKATCRTNKRNRNISKYNHVYILGVSIYNNIK